MKSPSSESLRAIANAGFTLHDEVKDVVSNGVWTSPDTLFGSSPILNTTIAPLLLDDQEDVLQWRKNNGSFVTFSIRNVWNTVREHANEVNWFHLVWSRYSIPRHAIHLWLVMRRRLKMHDRMRQWDVGSDID
nr:reverse transcriptase domain, reverse transcriptase zinc-binding domain protein [Tanacetum cinerariifolium]